MLLPINLFSRVINGPAVQAFLNCFHMDAQSGRMRVPIVSLDESHPLGFKIREQPLTSQNAWSIWRLLRTLTEKTRVSDPNSAWKPFCFPPFFQIGFRDTRRAFHVGFSRKKQKVRIVLTQALQRGDVAMSAVIERAGGIRLLPTNYHLSWPVPAFSSLFEFLGYRSPLSPQQMAESLLDVFGVTPSERKSLGPDGDDIITLEGSNGSQTVKVKVPCDRYIQRRREDAQLHVNIQPRRLNHQMLTNVQKLVWNWTSFLAI